jgi:chorismate mutase
MSRDYELERLRKQIDALDQELLETLARRMEVVVQIGRYKKSRGLELRDEQRLQSLIEAQLARAETLKLPSELVTELYELIHSFALKAEAEV